MNDFLTRMAQISRGEAALIAPRLPSLFSAPAEPGPGMTDEPPMQQREATGNVTGAARQPPPELTTTAADRHPRVGEVIQPAKKATGVTATDGPDMAPTTRTRMTRGEDLPAQPIHPPSSAAMPASRHGLEAPTTSRQRPRRSHASTPPPEADNSTIVSATSNGLPDATVRAYGQSQGIESEATTPLLPGYRSPQRPPHRVMAELPTATEPAGQTAPTVHINIGRIEVRARTMPPAAPAPRPSRPRPAGGLSLDDYLRRGGGRS